MSNTNRRYVRSLPGEPVHTKHAEGITLEFGRHRWRLAEFAEGGLLWSPVTPFKSSERTYASIFSIL